MIDHIHGKIDDNFTKNLKTTAKKHNEYHILLLEASAM